ncbi:MAG TPA: PLP-dependent aminotransferase family protein [Pseudoneobacillus sp.]|nr:PLP-dependent aminotransferase family protein [Pseudoneobacillus sp.]
MQDDFLAATNSKLLFEKVYDYLLHRIERKEWKENEKLPSIRQLSQELKVHRLTVFKAYQLLKEEGKVFVKDKSGYYVNPSNCQAMGHNDHPIVSSYYQKSHLAEIHRIPAVYQFSQALIEPTLLPNLYLSKYVKEVFDLYPKVLGTYSTVQGDEEFREAMARYFIKQHRLHLRADEILITSGAQQAIDLVSKIFVRPGDVILMERPTYSAAIDIFSQQGAKMVPIEIYPTGYNIEQVESYMKQYKPRLFYMNPTFHNPTGYIVPSEQRKQLVELAERYRCLLVEDDPFRDIYFDEEPPPPLFTYDTEGLVIYIRSFSKYISPGLRICAIACRPAIMKHLLIAKSLADNGSPLLNQKIFHHYFFSERMQKHLDKPRIALAIRKEIMEEELKNTGWEWESPKGGLNLWVQLPQCIPMEKLLAKSIEHSLSFVPGTICDPRREFHSTIRLSYSYINEQQIRIGLQRLVALAQT